MYTIAETKNFTADADLIWSEEERGEFYDMLANSPFVGDVVPGSGGCRKVRWSRAGMGKRGAVRVIYYNMLDDGKIWLLLIYTKATSVIPGHVLLKAREKLLNG